MMMLANRIPEQPLCPPEYADWSQSDINEAIYKLVEKIEDGADWDDDGSYKLDMATDILQVNFSKLDREDKNFEIQQIIEKYVKRWAKDAVNGNPDFYCTNAGVNDD